MRRILFSLALGGALAIAANLAHAQTDTAPPPPPGGRWHQPPDPAEQAAHLAKRLGLSTEQQTQVQAILTNQQTEMKALDQNQAITHQQWLAQTKSLHEATQSKIEGLLNDTQKQQFQQMMAHMHHGPPPSGMDGPPPPNE